MLVKDMPEGRVGMVTSTGTRADGSPHSVAPDYLYIMRFYGNFFVKFWTKSSATMENAKDNMEWTVDLLPDDTIITFKMDGVSWDRRD
jgi:hypothetical protein